MIFTTTKWKSQQAMMISLRRTTGPRCSPYTNKKLQQVISRTSKGTVERLQTAACTGTLCVSTLGTSEFEAVYATNTPLIYAGVVALIFAFTSIIFIVYDCLVEKRQACVINTAARANTIVDSLFPAMVRERVFQNNENRAKSTNPWSAQKKGNVRWSEMGAHKQREGSVWWRHA